VNGLCDRSEKGGDFRDELRGATEFGDPIDDGTADDNAVGKGGDLAGLFGCGDAEANTDGKGGRFFEEGNFFTEGGREALLHPGHTFTGNIVDKARSGGDERTNTGLGCGWCDEDDATQVAPGWKVARSFLGREVEKEKAIRSRLDGIRLKLFPPIRENGIVVGEKHEWDLTLFFS
jgi:hypothetical protein